MCTGPQPASLEHRCARGRDRAHDVRICNRVLHRLADRHVDLKGVTRARSEHLRTAAGRRAGAAPDTDTLDRSHRAHRLHMRHREYSSAKNGKSLRILVCKQTCRQPRHCRRPDRGDARCIRDSQKRPVFCIEQQHDADVCVKRRCVVSRKDGDDLGTERSASAASQDGRHRNEGVRCLAKTQHRTQRQYCIAFRHTPQRVRHDVNALRHRQEIVHVELAEQ